jgi:hypothetical protein
MADILTMFTNSDVHFAMDIYQLAHLLSAAIQVLFVFLLKFFVFD